MSTLFIVLSPCAKKYLSYLDCAAYINAISACRHNNCGVQNSIKLNELDLRLPRVTTNVKIMLYLTTLTTCFADAGSIVAALFFPSVSDSNHSEQGSRKRNGHTSAVHR